MSDSSDENDFPPLWKQKVPEAPPLPAAQLVTAQSGPAVVELEEMTLPEVIQCNRSNLYTIFYRLVFGFSIAANILE